MNKKEFIRKSLKGLLFFGLILIYLIIYPFIKKEDSKVTEIYFAERVESAHKIIIDRFNKIHRGKIKVIPIDFPNLNFSTNERKELLARSLRGRGDGIDLLAVDIIWVQRFAKWCEPLEKYFPEDVKNNFIQPALTSCYYNNKLVAIPVELVQGVMYYREDLLAKEKNGNEIIKKINQGISWNEFIKLKENIKSNNPYYIFPADSYEGFICIFIELLLGQNRNYFEKYGFNFNTPQAEKALQLLVDLIYKHNLTPQEVTNFTEIPSYKYFIENDGIFIRGWPTYDKDFLNTQLYSEKSKFLKKTHIPYFSKNEQATIFGGWNLMIPKFTSKKNEVLLFIKFLLSKESQEILYKESGYYPVIKTIYEDSTYIKKYPDLQQFQEMVKYGVSRPYNEEYTRYSEIMSYYFKQALLSQISVKDALLKATSAIKYKQVVFAQ